MDRVKIEGNLAQQVADALSQCALFQGVPPDDLKALTGQAQLLQYEAGEVIAREGEPATEWFLVVSGEVLVHVASAGGESVELARIGLYETVGELAVILGEQRTATLIAGPENAVLRFEKSIFAELMRSVPAFSLAVCRVFAARLKEGVRSVALPRAAGREAQLDARAARLLPLEFIQRQRVLPLSTSGSTVSVGFVDDPTPQAMTRLRSSFAGMTVRPVAISVAVFNDLMRTLGPENWAAGAGGGVATTASAGGRAALDKLLERMVAEGASDLHLSPEEHPRWRIDGDMLTIEGAPVLGPDDVRILVQDVTPARNLRQFEAENDTDFAYEIPGVARFRVNLFRERHGVGAVLRQIPSAILTAEQLSLPQALISFSDLPTGLVLVTGPTGSGKSTTLAAMVDHVNRTRKAHIITLEDPIEFVHQNQRCLVNQREVGSHTTSFQRALRAALREDPNVILVGEMRDLETVALALETANTGHLVLATLHTNSAVGTVSRIIDMFPSDQQPQIRTVLADVLRGVVTQTLCKRVGGGRVAAFEIMVGSPAVANLIREGKTHQLASQMQTGAKLGNQLLNDALVRLVQAKLVSVDEAIAKSVDRESLTQQLRR